MRKAKAPLNAAALSQASSESASDAEGRSVTIRLAFAGKVIRLVENDVLVEMALGLEADREHNPKKIPNRAIQGKRAETPGIAAKKTPRLNFQAGR